MKEFLESYGQNLKRRLIEFCTSRGVLGGEFLMIEELNNVWQAAAPEYMADAVPQIKDYPDVAVAWACYFGMGAAAFWDAGWSGLEEVSLVYPMIRDKRGFDCMDDYIAEELLCLEKDAAARLAALLGDCSSMAIRLLRKEGIEPQSVEAFHLFAKTTEICFELGVSLELYRMGYKYEKVVLN